MAKKSHYFAILKRKVVPYLPFLPKILAVIFTAILLVVFIKNFSAFSNQLKKLSPLKRTALSFIQTPQAILKTTKGRTNILLLGKGGAGHESPDLTDTIIFVSYHHPTGSALMLSLPRDIWIDSLKTKLNSIYYYGNLKQAGGGLILTKAAVEEIINQPVHYAVLIDFAGFTQAIDLLGGIEIDVKQAFDDYKYPIPGKETAQPEADRYQHLHFDAGPQVMDGKTALKYVRSRNASGEEGTDYARARRQQQVLLALQQKLLSTQVLLNPQKLSQLFQILNSSVNTDITNGEYTALLKIGLGFNRDKLQTFTLDQGNKDQGRQGLLVNPPAKNYQGQWVLTGRDASWQEVQQYVADLLRD